MCEKQCLPNFAWNNDRFSKDDYGGPGAAQFSCSFYHEPFRTLIKTNVQKFSISAHTALKLGIEAPASKQFEANS